MRDLQSQIERRDKLNNTLTEDLSKAREKMSTLLGTIEELQSSDSSNQLAAKRAERELREERERALRMERELEGWKGLRMERESLRRSGTLAPLALSDSSEARSRRGSSIGILATDRGSRPGSGSGSGDGVRKISGTKGFL